MSAIPLTARLRQENEAHNRQRAEARRNFAKAATLNSITAQANVVKRELQALLVRAEEARIRARLDPELLAAIDETAREAVLDIAGVKAA